MKSPFKDKPNIRRYSIIPARAMQDERLTGPHIKILACLGMYTNSYGVCWPSQTTIARHLGVGRVWVCRTMKILKDLGYVRLLEPRPYPKHIKRRSKGKVNRYQVLWEGNDPIPTNEQFWAPAKIIMDSGDDEVVPTETHMQTGGLGEGNSQYHILAHAFARAVESASGVNRQPQASMKAAKLLYDQGVKVDQVREATVSMTKDALRSNKAPPMHLDQVARWSALYNK